MVEQLKDWLNKEVKLSKKVDDISEDFHNGYLFAELLHKTKLIPNLSIYINSNKEKDIIHNFCFLSKTFLDMNIILDEKSRNNIINKSPYTSQKFLYKIKQVLDQKLISFDSLKFKQSNAIHKLYTSLMFKNKNEQYLKSREDKYETEGKKERENQTKTDRRLKEIKKRFRRLKFNDNDLKLIEQNIVDLEIYDEAHNDIYSLENSRKENLMNKENNQLSNWKKSMAGIRKDKENEHKNFWRRVFYYKNAALNYLNKSSINTQREIQNFEDNLERLGLNIQQDPQKMKKSQNVSTDVIMMKMREKLNEKMKQKKDKEKRDRKKLREELEMSEIKKSQGYMSSYINKNVKSGRGKNKNNMKRTELKENKRYQEIENLMPKDDEYYSDNKSENEENEEEKKDENKDEENEKEDKEKTITKSSFNEISENSKGMNLIKNSLNLHNSDILIGNRISLFKTLIKNKSQNEDISIPNIEISSSQKIDDGSFNKEEFFEQLDQINSEVFESEVQKKRKKKEKHFNKILPIFNQILDIVNEVGKYQNENNVDLINKDNWDDLTLKLINNEIIDSDLLNLMKVKVETDSEYEEDYGEKLNKKDEDELFDYCNYIGIFNDNIIPNEIKGFKYNFPDLYEGIYINDNGIDIKDYEPIPEEIENLILPNEKILNSQFGQIIDISLDNKYKEKTSTKKNFVEHEIVPISKDAKYNYIPIKISMLGSPLSGKKTQSKFLIEKFPNLKIYNLEEIFEEILKEYEEFNLPIDENPKVKNAKKNQIDQVKLEIEKQKEDFIKEKQVLIQPYLDLKYPKIEEKNEEEKEENNKENEEKKEENKEEKNEENKEENEENKEQENKNIEIPDEVFLNLFIYQLNKDFPNDINSRLDLITKLNEKYIKYQELQSKISSIQNQIKEEEEKEEEDPKKKKPNPLVVNLTKELDTIKKDFESLKPELYIGFIIINYPKTQSQANQLENFVTGYISEFDKPLDEKEIKLFSYSNIIDIPVKKNTNHDLIHSALDIVFNLNVDNDEILRRFNGLKYDPKDNKIYHVDDNPPNQNDKKLIERLENEIPGLSQNEFNEKKDNYERNINDLSNFYQVMGNGKLKTFNNINENDKELLKKINVEIETITEEVCDNFYQHIENFVKSIQVEKEEYEKKIKEEEELKKKEEEELKRKEEEEKKKKEKENKNENEESEESEEKEDDDFDNLNKSKMGNSNDISIVNFEEDNNNDNKKLDIMNLESENPLNLKISMRTAPNYEMIITEMDDLNNEYNKVLINFIHFTSRQQNHIINHLNDHQNSFIIFLNRKTNKKKIAQVYLNKYNDLIQNHPQLKNNPNVYRELLNDITIINAQLWNAIQLKKTEDVEKLQSYQNDGYKEKEIDFFYNYMKNIFYNEAKKYLSSINVIKQYYLYSASPDELEDFYIDYKNIISNGEDKNDNIVNKINNLFTNSLIMIIKQDEKIKHVFEDYKNNLIVSPSGHGSIRDLGRINSNVSHHSHRSAKTSKSKMKKKGKNVNLLNIIEEEFKNQIRNEKSKFKYRILLLKYFSINYVKKIYKVFDDVYVNLDEFIIDSVKKQNMVLNEFISYLKSSLNRFVNYVSSLEFEFDSFDIYNKYKLKIEDYFITIKEDDDKKIEIKKYNYSIVDLFNLYKLIKEYSSESINYLVKTNIVKEMLIKKYFIENPSNINDKAISQKIRELNFENYHHLFSLFEEFDGKYVNINQLFTTLILIGSNTISNEKFNELITENILKKEDFMKINFWFENDVYLSKPINEEEEKVIKEKNGNKEKEEKEEEEEEDDENEYKKIDLVKETIFEINQEDNKIDMRKLGKLFEIINEQEKKREEEKERRIKEEEERRIKEEEEKKKKEDENQNEEEEELKDEFKENINEEEKEKEEEKTKEKKVTFENKISKNIHEDIINEDDDEEESSNNENEEEDDILIHHKKTQKGKMSENKLLIFNLVFNIHNP